MKKVMLALFAIAFAIAGALSVNLASAETCGPSTAAVKQCPKVDVQSSDGAIGSTTNAATYMGACQLVNTYGGVSYFALRRYASVSTGAIVAPHVYALSPGTTGTPQVIPIDSVFANGVYGDALTGSVISRCGYRK